MGSQKRKEKYQKLKSVYAAQAESCPVSEDAFMIMSNEKYSKVAEILNQYPDPNEDEDLTVKPIELSKSKFGSDMLQSKDKIIFESDTLNAGIGKPVWIVTGANDYAMLPDGLYETLNRQQFTIENGALKSATAMLTNIVIPELQKQGFKTMSNNKNDFWSRIARTRELNARDSKEMTFKHDLNPHAKSNLTADEQSQFIADRNYLDGKTDDLFAKAERELKQDDLIVQPIEPDFTKMSAEEKTSYEEQRTRAYMVMHSADKKPEVKTKQPTQEDLAFERARSVFTAKPKKEISPEMKARLVQMGWIRPE